MSTYQTWRAMRKRCYYPKDVAFEHYGGRGITVCDRWNDSKTGFSAFVEDMGERPEGMTLDRMDVNGNYEKDNCKWSTYTEQNTNQRRHQFVKDMQDAKREDEEYDAWERVVREFTSA